MAKRRSLSDYHIVHAKLEDVRRLAKWEKIQGADEMSLGQLLEELMDVGVVDRPRIGMY